MTSVFEDHLSLDATVAYADGEMSLTAYQRAAAHLRRCGQCAAEVAEQTAASQYLRQASMPTMPLSLFDTLKSIPVAVPRFTQVPAPPAAPTGAPTGMDGTVRSVVTALSGVFPLVNRAPLAGPTPPSRKTPWQGPPTHDGQTSPEGSTMHDGSTSHLGAPPNGSVRSKWFRFGAGAMVVGFTLGAAVAAAGGDRPAQSSRPIPPDSAAVSGAAISRAAAGSRPTVVEAVVRGRRTTR